MAVFPIFPVRSQPLMPGDGGGGIPAWLPESQQTHFTHPGCPRRALWPPRQLPLTYILRGEPAYLVGFHPHLLQGRLEKLREGFPTTSSFDTTGILGKERRTWRGLGTRDGGGTLAWSILLLGNQRKAPVSPQGPPKGQDDAAQRLVSEHPWPGCPGGAGGTPGPCHLPQGPEDLRGIRGSPLQSPLLLPLPLPSGCQFSSSG